MITLLLADLSALHGSFSDSWRLRFARAGQSLAAPLFEGLIGDQWPLVEATYRVDQGAAPLADLYWLRFDPANAQPDINGVVMLGFGQMLNIRDDERSALLTSLSELLAEHDVVMHWPQPDRAYLGVPLHVALPSFTPTWDVLGEDLLEYFPGGEVRDDASRWWRALINDVQIALHDHPVNEQRRLQRIHPINLFWPWRSATEVVATPRLAADVPLQSPDPDLLAMWDWAGCEASLRSDASAAVLDGDAVVDLRDVTRCATLEREWLEPVFNGTGGRFDARFGDVVLRVRPRDGWKFWIK